MSKQSLVRLTLESSQYERGLRQAKRQLDDFTRSIGFNMKSLSGMAVAAGAVSGAMKVMKDAFFKNEEQLDEWGRTVQSCESLYGGFLNSLNSGDIGGFLDRIDDIIQAARDAYNALDDLATFNAFNQINEAAGKADLQDALNSFREGKGSKEAVLGAAESYKQNLSDRQKLERAAYEAQIVKIANERGIAPDDLKAALSGTWGHYKSIKDLPLTGRKTSQVVTGATFGQTMTVAVPANEAERLGQQLRKLNDTELDHLQKLGAAAFQTQRALADVDRQVLRVTRGETGNAGNAGRSGLNVGSRGGVNGEVRELTGLIEIQEKKIKDLRTAWSQSATKEGIEEYRRQIKIATMELDELKGKTMQGVSVAGGISGELERQREELRSKKLDVGLVGNSEGQVVSVSQTMGGIANGIGQIVSGIEQLGIDLPAGISKAIGVVQTVAGILTGISSVVTIIAAIQGAKATPVIGWMLANGGVPRRGASGLVPGNSMSGDNVPALLNSQELVLNRAQTGIIASALQGGGMPMKLEAYVAGSDLRLVMTRDSRLRGKGDYVTTKMRI